MNIFSTSYDWDKKDDDPLSNLLNNKSFSSKNSENNDNFEKTNLYIKNDEFKNSSSFLDNFLNENTSILNENKSLLKSDDKTEKKTLDYDWLGLKEEKNEIKFLDENKNNLETNIKRKKKEFKNETKIETKIEKKKDNSDDSIDNLSEKNDSKNLDFNCELIKLKTKISILEIEKQNLTESLENSNENYRKEIRSLKKLHDQQINLTKTILEEQKNLIKDERDKRIDELQNQLITLENYLDESRLKFNKKTTQLEEECSNEIERLQNFHEKIINRLIEQHEQNLDRYKELKEREIETLQNFQTKFVNLDELLKKWQINSEKMENLHFKLTVEQDKFLNDRLNDITIKDKQVEIIEEKWSNFANNLQKERESSNQLKEIFIKTVDNQKNFIEKEKEELKKERNEFEINQKNFLNEKRLIEIELEKKENLINQQLLEKEKQVEELNNKQIKLNKLELDLLKKENEFNLNYQKKNDQLIYLTKQVEENKFNLEKELAELKKNKENHKLEIKFFAQKKELFDQEKLKLENLAKHIAKKSDELEELSLNVNQDKKENENLFYETEKLKKEFDEKIIYLENGLLELTNKEISLEKQSEFLQEEWDNLQETKNSILCSLCANSIKKEKNNPDKIENFLNEIHSTKSYFKADEEDKSLLFWQLTSEEDAATLQEETEFIYSLKK